MHGDYYFNAIKLKMHSLCVAGCDVECDEIYASL